MVNFYKIKSIAYYTDKICQSEKSRIYNDFANNLNAEKLANASFYYHFCSIEGLKEMAETTLNDWLTSPDYEGNINKDYNVYIRTVKTVLYMREHVKKYPVFDKDSFFDVYLSSKKVA